MGTIEMTTSPSSSPSLGDFTLDAKDMTRNAINGFRAAFAIGGVVALILGIVLLVWPAKTVIVFAAVLGIFFISTGIIRIALGIFSFGTSAGHRVLSIVLGLFLLIAGIIALKNLASSAAALLVLVVVIVGVSWIIDGIMSIVESRSATSRGWAITYGIVGIIAGLFVVSVPGWSILWLILFSGIALVILGIVGIVRGFTFGREALKTL
jgi:uncharacterized membrane protein HdeD (DUF308 family)